VDSDRLGTMGWSNGGILSIGLTVWTGRFQVAGVGALMDPDVRKELGLSEEQVQKLRDVGREVMQGMSRKTGKARATPAPCGDGCKRCGRRWKRPR